jgi:hypothetical protein
MSREDHTTLLQRLEQRDDVETREQDVGRLSEQFDRDELDAIPQDEILETTGILSTVLDGDGSTTGHVLMVEYDNIDDPYRPIDTAETAPGISVVLRSSPRSSHVYNLSVRKKNEQLLDAMRKDGDPWQARWAARRGYFVLRVLPKFRSQSRKKYKDAPEPVAVCCSDSDYPQSQPHLSQLLNLAGRHRTDELQSQMADAREQHEMVGSTFQVEHYQTVTDDAKEVLD